jgi:hypothetical protein
MDNPLLCVLEPKAGEQAEEVDRAPAAPSQPDAEDVCIAPSPPLRGAGLAGSHCRALRWSDAALCHNSLAQGMTRRNII